MRLLGGCYEVVMTISPVGCRSNRAPKCVRPSPGRPVAVALELPANGNVQRVGGKRSGQH